MISNLDYVLEDCLERIAQGETIQSCLERYPERATELEPLLAAAARFRHNGQVRPSSAFKARTRAQLYAHMDAHPRHRNEFLRFPSALRLVSYLATLLLAFTVTGTALAQAALPGEVLYPWKLASERAWRSVSPDPVGVDLVLGDRRIDEAVAVSHNVTAQDVALHGYQKVITDLTQYNDSSAQTRIQSGLENQAEKLQDAGLQLPPKDEQDILPDPNRKNPVDSVPRATADAPGSRAP